MQNVEELAVLLAITREYNPEVNAQNVEEQVAAPVIIRGINWEDIPSAPNVGEKVVSPVIIRECNKFTHSERIDLVDNKQNSDNEQFDRIANDYKNWEMHAQDLKYASSLLKKNIEKFEALWKAFKETGQGHEEILKIAGLSMISLMLQGYALEVFVKAVFIKKGHMVAQSGNCLFSLKGADSHNLKLILEDIDIFLNDYRVRSGSQCVS